MTIKKTIERLSKRLSDDSAMTIRWLSNDSPMTLRWLSDDYPMTIQWLSDDYPMTIQWVSNDYPMTIRWLSNDYHQLLIYFSWWSWDRRWLFKSSATFILKDLSTEILAILANFSYFWGKFTHIFGVPFRGCGLPKLTNIRCGQDTILDWDLK